MDPNQWNPFFNVNNANRSNSGSPINANNGISLPYGYVPTNPMLLNFQNRMFQNNSILFGSNLWGNNSMSALYGEANVNMGIEYEEIESIYNAMDNKELLRGSIDLLRLVNENSFFLRLNHVWDSVEQQSNYLRVIVGAACTKQMQQMTQEFMNKILESSLIGTIVDKEICPMPYDIENRRTRHHANLAHYFTELLVLGFEISPAKMNEHLSKVQNVFTSMKMLKDENGFLLPQTLPFLERLEAEIRSRYSTQKSKKPIILSIDPTNEAAAIAENASSSSDFPPPKSNTPSPEPEFLNSPEFDDEELTGLPTNFRNLPIVPRAKDMELDYEPFLRVAEKKYESTEHYLDVQFRLLREDLIRPLRLGIAAHKKGYKDLRVYRDVKLDEPVLHIQSGEFIHYANIKITKQILYNKAMKYFSLLCLSSDNFQEDFVFATVTDRDDKKLEEGKFGIKIENNAQINTNLLYNMVESPAFFEAYRHVLSALQSIPIGTEIPFSKYLIHASNKTKSPSYLPSHQAIDFSCILTSEAQENLSTTNYTIQSLQQNLNCNDFGMDESQFNALLHTLKSELTVIQGPPGTGKSYMGLKIAELLLHESNSWLWSPENDPCPMLVVCYTNHALDQFLEGINNFLGNDGGIIRVGGRSKSGVLQRYQLFQQRKFASSEIRDNYNTQFKEVKKLLYSIKDYRNMLKQLETAMPNKLFLSLLENEKIVSDCKALNLFVSEVLDSDLLIPWLTKHSQNENKLHNNIAILRQLDAWGVKEIRAKNALAYSYDSNLSVKDAAVLYRKLKKAEFKVNLSHEFLIDSAKHWPKLSELDEIMRMGYSEKIAIEMFASTKNNMEIIKTEHKLRPIKSEIDDSNKPDEEEMKMFKENDRAHEDLDYEFMLDEAEKEAQDEVKNKASFVDHIINSPPMPEMEANEIENIWQLPLQIRWRLYKLWVSIVEKPIKEKLNEIEKEYSVLRKKLTEERLILDMNIMRTATVIGMTTTAAARYQSILRSIRPRIIIAEEAAEVFEAHLVTSLTEACEHFILIGDHKQLRPKPAVYELEWKYKLQVSLFERMVKNRYPFAPLKNQHRMRPEISKTLMPHFYPILFDDPSVLDKNVRPDMRGVEKNLFFINHSEHEQYDSECKSHKNLYEVEYAVQLAKYFKQQDYKTKQITILTTYLEQLITLRNRFKEVFDEKHGFRIDIVDNFQGEESDIIILSMVRSVNYENKIGFLNISNRVCVALSRAKIGFYIIGNIQFLADCCQLWRDILESAKKIHAFLNELEVICQMHGTTQIIKTYEDFETLCPEGGCQEKCPARLKCGHKCKRLCHGNDIDHVKSICEKPCNRVCSEEFEHPCKMKCFEECNTCEVQICKILPCGHKAIAACYEDSETIKCKETIAKKNLKCGHELEMECNENRETFDSAWECHHPCGKVFDDCGHVCQGTCASCHQGRLHIPCEEPCEVQLICGHICKSKCYQPCPPCQSLCETACPHSQCSTANAKGKTQREIRWLKSQAGKQKGRLCSEACPPCIEKCDCGNYDCNVKCSDICKTPLKIIPCGKSLACMSKKKKPSNDQHHTCIGLKDEKCINICKNCNQYDFAAIKKTSIELQKKHFGTTRAENSCFIQLEDCKHIFEVNFLDKYIRESLKLQNGNGENQETKIKKLHCPECNAPIFSSKRYNSYLNLQANDIENVKQILNRYSEDLNRQHNFQSAVADLIKTLMFMPLVSYKAREKLRDAFSIKPQMITPFWFVSVENNMKIIEILCKFKIDDLETGEITQEIIEILIQFSIFNMNTYLKAIFNTLLEQCSYVSTSNYFYQQFKFQVQLFGFVLEFFSYLTTIKDPINELKKKLIFGILKTLQSTEEFQNESKYLIWQLFALLKDESFDIVKIDMENSELNLVSKNIKWYKFSDGKYKAHNFEDMEF